MVDINKTIKETVKLKRDKYPALGRYVDLHSVEKKSAPAGNSTEPATKKDASRKADKNEGDKIYESTSFNEWKENLSEAISSGKMKLKDGSSVNVSDKDAKVLNKLVSTLSGKNKKDMMETLHQNKEEFNAILGFAKETV